LNPSNAETLTKSIQIEYEFKYIVNWMLKQWVFNVLQCPECPNAQINDWGADGLNRKSEHHKHHQKTFNKANDVILLRAFIRHYLELGSKRPTPTFKKP